MTRPRPTAEEQLERILYILPAAARASGARVEDLARELRVEPQQVLADLAEATARSYHHPGGVVEPFSILFSTRRVHVHAPEDFNRPVRLGMREGAALELGLRALAAEVPERRAAIHDLARRLAAALCAPDVLDSGTGAVHEDGVEYDTHELALELGSDAFRGAIAEAIEQQRVCDVIYLKPAAPTSEPRRLAPYRLVYAAGYWYVAAYDVERHGLRFFRMDRIVAVDVADEAAPPPPPDFEAWLASAPYRAEEELEVTVRYDRTIARWLLERVDGEVDEDGAVHVRHRVADAGWLVRHVLQYGGAAVVTAPPRAAAWVAAAAARLAG